MAISTPTNIAAVTGGSTANASIYTTASSVLSAGATYLLTIGGYRSGGGQTPSQVSHDPAGTPLSFSLVSAGGIGAEINNYDAVGRRHVSVWRVTPVSDTGSAGIRITFPATQSSAGWSLTELETGVDGVTPVVQVKKASGTASTAANPGAMSTFTNADSLTYLAIGWGDGTANPTETIVATESRTELEEHSDGERLKLSDHYQNPNGGDTSIGATLSATVDWGAIGIEFLASAGALSDDVLIRLGSIDYTSGSGLVTPFFWPSEVVGGSASGGGYYWRRRRLDELTAFEEV